MSQSGSVEFSSWRAFLWPVHRHELKKLIPMLLIFFLISFDYNILRTLKDTLVVTAKSSGAEVIPFIKVWMMFPGAVLMTFIFTRLSNRLNREKVFYAMISVFLIYFFAFVFLLYPNRDSLHPHELADYLESVSPAGFKGMIAMFRYWTFTTFYVMSELWSNIILAMLFWGFANQITKIGEAKRFYGLFGIGVNFSGIAAGQLSVLCCTNSYNPNFWGADAWEQTLISLVSLVLLAGVAALGIFRWMNKQVLTDPLYYNPTDENRGEVTGRMSMRENFSYLFKSRYLSCIAIVVIAYNLVINLVEVLWKAQVRELYPNPTDYTLYMNQVTTIIGVISTLAALFISGNSIRKCGWTFTALLTPVILLLTSVGFFTFFFMKSYSVDLSAISLAGATPLALVVFFGTAQNCLCRAAKYSVFDATREMAFVPLSSECKIKGKAAIDGVCNRLGKSGGSVIHQTLLLIFASLSASAPYVAGILVATISLWIYAVSSLGKKFTSLTSAQPATVPLNNHPVGEVTLQEQQA